MLGISDDPRGLQVQSKGAGCVQELTCLSVAQGRPNLFGERC